MGNSVEQLEIFILTLHKIQGDQPTTFHHFFHHIFKFQIHTHKTSSQVLSTVFPLPLSRISNFQDARTLRSSKGCGMEIIDATIQSSCHLGVELIPLQPWVLPEPMPAHSMVSLMLVFFPYSFSHSPSCPLQSLLLHQNSFCLPKFVLYLNFVNY